VTSKININVSSQDEDDIVSIGSKSKVEKSVLKKIYAKLPKKLQLKIVEFVKSPFGSTMVSMTKKLSVILSQVYKKVSKVSGVVFQAITVWLSKLGRKIGQQLQSKYGRKLWYKRWLAKLSQLRMGTRGMKGTRIGVSRLKNQNIGNRTKVIIIVIAIVLLFIGFRWIQQKRVEFGVHMQVLEKMESVETRLDEAERLANTDKAKARQKFGEALEILDSTEEIVMITEDENAVNKLYDRLNDLNVDINDVVIVGEGIGNIEVFLDGKLSFGDSSDLSDIDIRRDQYMNEQLFISDRGEGAVFRVALYNESVVMVEDDSAVLTEPEYLSIGNSGLYVYENDSGMYKSSFDSNGKNTNWKPLPALGVDSVGKRGVSDLAMFTVSDNVYLLGQDEGNMLKSYSFENGGYGLPVTYLEDEEGENVLANSTDLLGDYFYVYILSEESNGIYRYISEQGTGLKLDAIEVLGVYPELQNVQAGFTGPSMNDDFYVFDKGTGNYDGSGRILRFEKPNAEEHRHVGQFVLVKQYVYRGQKDGVFDDVQDIVVDAAQKYMYVVDGVKVWKIEL
ncbi:MAG: hypothetical protein U9R21_08055, partial [Candidatus Thermoplasmatota archaeon]|nr:hypothetical protein [Candidatus Thermoplasmatota archaeon]